MRELRDQLPWFLDHFDRGLLFYYVGNGDLVSHMMWRSMDPEHPAYDAERDAPYADVIPRVYEEMDAMVTYTLDHMGDDTLLIVMSDHGFTSWRRTFHLNAWLHQNGYLAVKDESLPEVEALLNVDWSGTRAYGIGLNGLYINVAGRERDGIVPPEERAALVAEIAGKLEASHRPRDRASRRSPRSTCGTRPSPTAATGRSVPTRSSGTRSTPAAPTRRRSAWWGRRS